MSLLFFSLMTTKEILRCISRNAATQLWVMGIIFLPKGKKDKQTKNPTTNQCLKEDSSPQPMPWKVDVLTFRALIPYPLFPSLLFFLNFLFTFFLHCCLTAKFIYCQTHGRRPVQIISHTRLRVPWHRRKAHSLWGPVAWKRNLTPKTND